MAVSLKDDLLATAEVLDALRVFPRLIIGAFGWLLAYVIASTLEWYFYLAPADRTTQVTAVIGIIVPSVFGLGGVVYKIYSVGGRDWTPPKDEA